MTTVYFANGRQLRVHRTRINWLLFTGGTDEATGNSIYNPIPEGEVDLIAAATKHLPSTGDSSQRRFDPVHATEVFRAAIAVWGKPIDIKGSKDQVDEITQALAALEAEAAEATAGVSDEPIDYTEARHIVQAADEARLHKRRAEYATTRLIYELQGDTGLSANQAAALAEGVLSRPTILKRLREPRLKKWYVELQSHDGRKWTQEVFATAAATREDLYAAAVQQFADGPWTIAEPAPEVQPLSPETSIICW